MSRPQLMAVIVLAGGVISVAGAEAPDVSETSEPPRARSLSPRLSTVIAETLPKFESVKTEPSASAVSAPSPNDVPRNGIVRLPTYIVRKNRPPPAAEDMLTTKGREAAAADRYLGPSGGLNRALNAVTLTDLWKKLPIVGKIPFVPFKSMNNGERALFVNDRAEQKRRLQEITGFEPLPETPPAAKKPTP